MIIANGVTLRGQTDSPAADVPAVTAPPATKLQRQDERSRSWSQRLPAVARARFELRSLAGQHPRYIDYLRRKHRALGWLDDESSNVATVDQRTDLVIEAFWRSGNTFALAAFLLAQDDRPRVGHHVCQPAQVGTAVRLGVPVLVIARDPRSTILSALQWGPLYSPRQWLRIYTRYYERVARIARQSGRVTVADFTAVTRNFGLVTERLNGRFGTSFVPFVHTDDNVAACYRLIEADDRRTFGAVTEERVSRPSPDRQATAERLAAELADPRYERALARAQRAYRAVLHASPT